MFLKFWGVRQDGEYSPAKKQPRPGWTYRCERRNAARQGKWPSRYRWRVFLKELEAKIAEAMRSRGITQGST